MGIRQLRVVALTPDKERARLEGELTNQKAVQGKQAKFKQERRNEGYVNIMKVAFQACKAEQTLSATAGKD